MMLSENKLSVVVLLVAVVAISNVVAAGPASDEARRLTRGAAQAYEQGRYEQALVGFERSMAYQRSDLTTRYIVVCSIQLDQPDTALIFASPDWEAIIRERGAQPIREALRATGGSGVRIQDEEQRREFLTRVDSEVGASGSTTGSGAGSSLEGRARQLAQRRGAELFRSGLAAVRRGNDSEALAFFERSMAYRPRRDTVYNIAACHILVGHRDLARTCLEIFLQEREDARSDPRVRAVRRALEESPESIGSTERRDVIWRGLSGGIEEPMSPGATGSGSRAVPEHIDRAVAAIEESFHPLIGGSATCDLVRIARSKDEELMSPPMPQGPCQRAALSRSLILIYEELDRRLGTALGGGLDSSERECLGLDTDSPLAGDLNDVAPFGMLDPWTAIHADASRECPEPTPTPRPRRRATRTPTPTPAVRNETPESRTVSPTPTPTLPSDSCELRENWVRCALRDPRITSSRIRHMLRTYPNMAPEFIRYLGVCRILQNSGWTLEDIEVIGRGQDPNQWIRQDIAERPNYDSFVAGLGDLDRRVNASASFINSCEIDQEGCPGTLSQSCLLLREQWYWPRQRNPRSVYYLPR